MFSVVVAQFVTLMIEMSSCSPWRCCIVGNMVLPWLPVLMVVLVLLAIFTHRRRR